MVLGTTVKKDMIAGESPEGVVQDGEGLRDHVLGGSAEGNEPVWPVGERAPGRLGGWLQVFELLSFGGGERTN